MEINLKREVTLKFSDNTEELIIFRDLLRYADQHMYKMRQDLSGDHKERIEAVTKMIETIGAEIDKLGELHDVE